MLKGERMRKLFIVTIGILLSISMLNAFDIERKADGATVEKDSKGKGNCKIVKSWGCR